MTDGKDPVIQDLLKEVEKEESAVTQADAALGAALANFNVSTFRYAAVRDWVTKYIGQSPYSKSFHWPLGIQAGPNPVLFRGQYRFIHMKPGDAVIEVLKEADEDEPMTLEEIISVLKAGHINDQEVSLTRAVNASLMRMGGVQKTEDGRYFYVNIDDMPI